MESKEIISSGILELYVLGQTSSQENVEIMHWANLYPEVHAEIEAIQISLEKYAAANAIEPPKEVKDKLFAKINETPSGDSLQESHLTAIRSNPVVSISSKMKFLAAASILFLVASAVINYIYINKYNNVNSQLAQTRSLLEKEQQISNELKSDWDIVKDPNNTAVSLKGVEANPNATAKIFWFQQTGEVMIDASNLPQAPAGMQYQFWAIIDGKPVDGGLIINNNDGTKYRMQKMKSFGKAQAFAISLEKTGGNAVPTVVVSLGKVI